MTRLAISLALVSLGVSSVVDITLVRLSLITAFAHGNEQQVTTPPTEPAPGAPGVIRGRITAADTGRPLRRATVSLRPDAGPAGRSLVSVSTNAQGQFELRDVPPGSYFVSATRAGFIEIQHGQRRPRERGVAIEIRNGQTRERVDIALPKGSVIAGRVVDELGAPYPGVTLIALEMRYELGQRTYLPVSSAVTDDLGQYRIAGMQPGRYYVLANSGETWRNEKKETFGYAGTFFPSAQTLDVAQAITLGIGEEQATSDLVLVASRTARIRGRVQRPTGEPLGGEAVSLSRSISARAVLASGLSTRTASDGSFELRDVPPGAYSLRASSSGASASMLLHVAGADVDNLVLVPRSGSTLIGTIVTEEGETPPFPASGVRVNLIAPPGADVLPTVRVPGVDNDWTIRMTSVGGPFVFRMVGLPDSWMLDAVKLGERDITDAPYEVPTGGLEISNLQFVLTNRVGTVSGSVVNADGKPTRDATVVIFADDASLWTIASRFVRSTRPTIEGKFSITGLPAGDYLAVAREFVTDGEWESKEFLQAARQDAVRVTLQRGGIESIALKVR